MAHDPELIKEAQQHCGMGIDQLTKVLPLQLKAIIERGAWEGRERKDGKPFQTFYEFVCHPLWWGLGVTGEGEDLNYEDVVGYAAVCHKDIERLLRDQVPALGRHGGKREQGAIGNLKKGSNQATYLASRLKRDHPDIAERLAAGEFKSVRAAAIFADIVKVPTQLDLLRKAWRKATDADRKAFLTEIT